MSVRNESLLFDDDATRASSSFEDPQRRGSVFDHARWESHRSTHRYLRHMKVRRRRWHAA